MIAWMKSAGRMPISSADDLTSSLSRASALSCQSTSVGCSRAIASSLPWGTWELVADAGGTDSEAVEQARREKISRRQKRGHLRSWDRDYKLVSFAYCNIHLRQTLRDPN